MLAKQLNLERPAMFSLEMAKARVPLERLRGHYGVQMAHLIDHQVTTACSLTGLQHTIRHALLPCTQKYNKM